MPNETIEPRLKRIPGVVGDTSMHLIKRAVTLRLAMIGEIKSEDPEMLGNALAVICMEWTKARVEALREKNGEMTNDR